MGSIMAEKKIYIKISCHYLFNETFKANDECKFLLLLFLQGTELTQKKGSAPQHL